MVKKSILRMTVLFLSLLLCVLFSRSVNAATIVNFDSSGDSVLSDVAAFQFDILSPDTVYPSDFIANWPSGWTELSGTTTVAVFDLTGSASLTDGEFGRFEADVILGNWVLGNQNAVSLELGVDYVVHFNEGENIYTVKAASVPIPGAIWLLCSGLVGLVGIRRRFVS